MPSGGELRSKVLTHEGGNTTLRGLGGGTCFSGPRQAPGQLLPGRISREGVSQRGDSFSFLPLSSFALAPLLPATYLAHRRGIKWSLQQTQ